MSMWRSPHRKHRPSPINADIQLPIGKKRGALASFKASGGNNPGKAFKDAVGKWHTVPRKTKQSKLASIAASKKVKKP